MDYCDECKGPLAEGDGVEPITVKRPGQSCLRHSDHALCDQTKKFYREYDARALAELGVMPTVLPTAEEADWETTRPFWEKEDAA